MLKKTKIVCTLGPSSNTQETIEKMIKAGMNVARFNFSHGSHEEHKQRIDMVRAASKKLGVPVALLLDTKGPEIRLGKFKNGSIQMEAGNEFRMSKPATIFCCQTVWSTWKLSALKAKIFILKSLTAAK